MVEEMCMYYHGAVQSKEVKNDLETVMANHTYKSDDEQC